jgi:3-phenylpropionate/trans-cinnamate dioxygenase ferredoxin subunit
MGMYNYTVYDPSLCEFVPVTGVDELRNGERIFIEIDDRSIVLFNIAESFFAIADICSHDDGPVGEGDLEGFQVICPRHGARFDVRNGKVLSLPAYVDIPAYPVRVMDGQIEIGVPSDR